MSEERKKCVVEGCCNILGNRNTSGYCQEHKSLIPATCICCGSNETKQQWYAGPLCRDCFKNKYYHKHQDHIKAYNLSNHYNSREIRVAKMHIYRDNNKEKIKITAKKWKDSNREKVRINANIKYKEYYNNSPSFYLSVRLRSRIRFALKRQGASKSGSAVRDLGCTIEELRSYLESKFQEGMSWENHGSNGWHIDHVVPLSSFDLTDPEQFKIACHYLNLQPLWAKDNLVKSNTIPENAEELCQKIQKDGLPN